MTEKQRFLSLSSIIHIGIFCLLMLGFGFSARWLSLGSIFFLGLAAVAWFTWIIEMFWILLRHRHRFRIRSVLLGLAGGVAAMPLGFVMSLQASDLFRTIEVSRAIKSGLAEDSRALLQEWPVESSRIHHSDPEFNRLPAGILELNPVYIQKWGETPTGLPPSIGVCKNGFGGFAAGVRIFLTAEDEKAFQQAIRERKPLAPGVYIWFNPT